MFEVSNKFSDHTEASTFTWKESLARSNVSSGTIHKWKSSYIYTRDRVQATLISRDIRLRVYKQYIIDLISHARIRGYIVPPSPMKRHFFPVTRQVCTNVRHAHTREGYSLFDRLNYSVCRSHGKYIRLKRSLLAIFETFLYRISSTVIYDRYSYLIALQHRFATFVVERLSHRVRRQVFLLGQIEGGVRINVFGIFGYSFQRAHLATGWLLARFPHGRVVLFPLLHVMLVLQRSLRLRIRIVRSTRSFRFCNHRD